MSGARFYGSDSHHDISLPRTFQSQTVNQRTHPENTGEDISYGLQFKDHLSLSFHGLYGL